MKPFNLEKAISGAPIVTRGGKEARFVAYLPQLNSSHKLVAHVDGMSAVLHFSDDGEFYFDGGMKSNMDLFMKRKTRKVWTRGFRLGGSIYFTIGREKNEQWSSKEFWATEPFEVEVDA